jgi:hypothetical protein
MNMTTETKQPSEDLISMIKVAGDSLLSFGELWGSIKKKGEQEGFSEKELQEMLRPYLKQKMDSKKIWYLFNKEEEQERNKQNYQSRTFKQKINENKEPEQNTPPSPEQKPILRQQEEKDEEPTEAELLKIENEQLKDALHKTEQFKPAAAFEEPAKENVKGMGFEFLREVSDGIHSFYYDAYGIDLFKNRELAQLKNSGVKTFKRLYFEV